MIADHLTNRPRKVYTSTITFTATNEELITLAGCLLHCPFNESALGSTRDHVINVLLTEIKYAIETVETLNEIGNGTTKTHPSQD